MKSRAPILALALVVLLGVVSWLAFGLRGGGRRDELAPDPRPAFGNTPSRSEEELAAAPERDLAPDGVKPERARALPLEGRDAETLLDPELRNAHWVEGRVEPAEGTPLDEELYVLARGRAFENRPLHRSKVEPDGTFQVAFAQGTVVGWLTIDARYNFLGEDLAVRPKAPPKDIVLRGTLGGCIRGRILLPPTAMEYAAGVAQGDVSAGEHEIDFFNIGRKAGRVREDLTFEVGGVEARTDVKLSLRARGLATCSKSNLTVEAGRITVQDLAPDVGVRLTGRVVDAGGGAVPGARVRAGYGATDGERNPAEFLGEFQQALVTTGADGAFDLLGLRAGELGIVVERDGLRPTVLEMGRLELGARRDGLTIVIEQGLSITGRVEYPGGTPASLAQVEIEEGQLAGPEQAAYARYGSTRRMERTPVETASDGSFRISGLFPGSYTVITQAWRSKTDDAASVEDEADRTRKVRRKGAPWSARLERVQAGATDVVVTLQGGETIRGRVTDSGGKPVERFVVTATPDRRSEGYTSEIKEIERAFRDKDGRFALEGLRPCGWSIRVRAKTCLDGEGLKITVPGANQNLQIVLLRHPELRGVVLDPEGRPLANAKVSCWHDSDKWWRARTEVRTNPKGEFRLREVPVGPTRLRAEAAGFAHSEALLLDLAPGAVRTGLSLSVCKPAVIRGAVLDEAGKPGAGRTVTVEEVAGQFSKNVKTDAEGKFEVRELGPGRYALQTAGTESEQLLGSIADADEFEARMNAFDVARTTVLVRAGETVSVTLGARSAPAIRMHGRITVASGRAESISARPLGGESSGRAAKSQVAADGGYELRLARAGSYLVSVELEDTDARARWIVDVPAGAEFGKDFEFPTGRIAGRVVDAEGAPVAGQNVEAWPPGSRDEVGDARARAATTDDNGRFEIIGLAPATYTVEVTGRTRWWEESPDAGRARREGVVVAADKSPEDVELVLARGGSVSGTIRSASGDPLPWVEVFAFDEAGHAVARPSPEESGASGRFTLEGLPSGRVLLYARSTRSAGKAAAIVDDAAPVEIDIVLRPSADLTVLARDAGGAATFAPLEIVDADGRHFEEIEPLARFVDAPLGARSFPSLPAGRLAVRMWTPAGEVREKSVLLEEGGRADVAWP